jgi:membrane-bound metal-dependent hydrolase YbcI (DUF457 family)
LFAVGHMALAYLLAKPAAKFLKVNLNIPLLLVLAVIPDIDLLLFPSLHRGPTHSLVMAAILFIPVFFMFGRKAAPYFLALASHAALADFLIGGQLMLLWPVTQMEFGLHELGSYYIGVVDPVNVALEACLFAVAFGALCLSGDIRQFWTRKKSNLPVAAPVLAMVLPVLGFQLYVPLGLFLPHVVILGLFGVSFAAGLLGFVKKREVGG